MSSEQSRSHQSTSRVSCCFATSLSFLIIVPTLCLTLALRLHPDGDGLYDSSLDWTDTNRTVFLTADLISADIPHDIMLVEWAVWRDTCNDSCTDVNIFFDTNLSPSDDRHDNGHSSNNRPIDPIFTWNATVMNSSSGPDPLGNAAIFRMKLNISPLYDDLRQNWLFSHGTLAPYPFDYYFSLMFAFAQEVSTNKSVPLALTSASRRLADLKITTDDVGSDPAYRELFGQEIIEVVVTLQRSTLVIAYCLVITATFWMVTLMICLIMITTVVFGYRQRNEIVVVPVGTVFAFTQLRSTMPGAPEGFGDVLDLVGLLPCLVLLSICAVTMIGIYVFTDPHDPSRKAFTWDELVNVLHCFKQRIWNTANEWVQWAQFHIRTARRKSSNIVEIPLTNLACENRA